jgi:hypothetical protein
MWQCDDNVVVVVVVVSGDGVVVGDGYAPGLCPFAQSSYAPPLLQGPAIVVSHTATGFIVIVIAVAAAAVVGGGGSGSALWKGVGLESGEILVRSLKTRTCGYRYGFFTSPDSQTHTRTRD